MLLRAVSHPAVISRVALHLLEPAVASDWRCELVPAPADEAGMRQCIANGMPFFAPVEHARYGQDTLDTPETGN